MDWRVPENHKKQQIVFVGMCYFCSARIVSLKVISVYVKMQTESVSHKISTN